MATTSVLDAVLAVFMAIAEWFTDAIPVITAFFYAEGALTFMGVLAVAGLAISEVHGDAQVGRKNQGKGQRFPCPDFVLLLLARLRGIPPRGCYLQLPPL